MTALYRQMAYSIKYLTPPPDYFKNQFQRNFADGPKKRSGKGTISNQVVVQGTENEERTRVRRARPADVPRVMRFVIQHAGDMWPGLTSPAQPSRLVLADYVARALAQGHSMIAERQESRNLSKIRALALSATMCKWDPIMLEKWAHCIQCPRSQSLLLFTAHCLRAPALHDKYQVQNIMQVILIVPPGNQVQKELVHMLVKSAVRRGQDVGISVLRFDVNNDAIARALDELHLNREWQIAFDVLPDAIKEREGISAQAKEKERGHFLAVYTAFTKVPIMK